MRVAIAGAGNVGLFIGNAMRAAGHDVLLMDNDEQVVASRSAKCEPGIEWRNVDACEVNSLRSCALDSYDVLVAATGDDEDNLVVSLLGKQEFAVPRVIARVNNPNNEWLFNETWGVDIAVSTPHLIAGLVEEAVMTGRLVRLLQLDRGRARLVEVTLDGSSPIVGHAIRDLDVPRDFNFVAVLRDGHVVVPRGDTTFYAGDEVMALVTDESEDDVRKLLIGP